MLQSKINFHFRRLKDGRLFEELALIRELGAYSRGVRIRYYCVEGGHLFEGDA